MNKCLYLFKQRIKCCISLFGIIVSLTILYVPIVINAQESHDLLNLTPEQLLNHLRSFRHIEGQQEFGSESHEGGKCNFWIQAQVANRWKEFSTAQRNEVIMMQQQDTTLPFHTVIGRFRISYDTNSTDAPALLDSYFQPIPYSWQNYVDSVGEIFNYVWDIEIDQMGYTAPPLGSGQSYYNIYIRNLDSAEYGGAYFNFGNPIGPGNPPRYLSYIIIDNDYELSVRSTSGMNALKVTAAHEYHHAIQLGSYGYWASDIYAHELTSVWMEDAVYTEINDYYQYLHNYFDRDDVIGGFWKGWSLYAGNQVGYERCVWAIYLAKRYGDTLMRDVWTEMRVRSFLESNEAVLLNRGSSFQEAFAEFTRWNYFTGARADTVKYYTEGKWYPRYKPYASRSFYGADIMVSGNVLPLSCTMYEFITPNDTNTVVIANVDITAAKNRSIIPQNVEISVSLDPFPTPFYEFENGLKVRVSVADTSLWSAYFSKTSSVKYSSQEKQNISPNPLSLSKTNEVLLPLNKDETGSVDVYFYSSSFALIHSAEGFVTYRQQVPTIAVDVATLREKLASGVYFVFAKTTKREYRWKVAVIR